MAANMIIVSGFYSIGSDKYRSMFSSQHHRLLPKFNYGCPYKTRIEPQFNASQDPHAV